MSEIDTKPEAELQRYWNPRGGGVEPHDAGLLYLRDDVDAVIAALAAERDAMRAEIDRLRNALMFYADEAGNGYDVCPRDYGLSYDEGQIIKDAGDRARAALKGAANG